MRRSNTASTLNVRGRTAVFVCYWIGITLLSTADPDPKATPTPTPTATPCVARCNPPPTPTPTPDPKCPACTPVPTPEGPCYDPQTQGCCNGTVYALETQGCCNGQVYDLETHACCMGQNVYDMNAENCCEDGTIIPIESCCINSQTLASSSAQQEHDVQFLLREVRKSLRRRNYVSAVESMELLLSMIDRYDHSSDASFLVRGQLPWLRHTLIQHGRLDLCDRIDRAAGIIRIKSPFVRSLPKPVPLPTPAAGRENVSKEGGQ